MENGLHRFRRWVKEGLWDKIFRKLLKRSDLIGNIDRTVLRLVSSITINPSG